MTRVATNVTVGICDREQTRRAENLEEHVAPLRGRLQEEPRITSKSTKPTNTAAMMGIGLSCIPDDSNPTVAR